MTFFSLNVCSEKKNRGQMKIGIRIFTVASGAFNMRKKISDHKSISDYPQIVVGTYSSRYARTQWLHILIYTLYLPIYRLFGLHHTCVVAYALYCGLTAVICYHVVGLDSQKSDLISSGIIYGH